MRSARAGGEDLLAEDVGVAGVLGQLSEHPDLQRPDGSLAEPYDVDTVEAAPDPPAVGAGRTHHSQQ